jgi:branched-chain amino acid transport system permease protein
LPLQEKAAYLPDLPSWIAGIHFDEVVGPVPVGFLAATLIAAVLVSAIAWLVGRVLMRLSGHFVAVATLGFLVIVRVVLFNADAFTRGSRTFSNVTPYTNLWWTPSGPSGRSTSCGGSSARATVATCSPSARIGWPPSRSGSG